MLAAVAVYLTYYTPSRPSPFAFEAVIIDIYPAKAGFMGEPGSLTYAKVRERSGHEFEIALPAQLLGRAKIGAIIRRRSLHEPLELEGRDDDLHL